MSISDYGQARSSNSGALEAGEIMLTAAEEAGQRAKQEKARFEQALAELRGSAGPGMSTDELMRLTRGWGEPD